MKVTCIIQARMGSTRLPGKAMMDLCGRPMLAHILDRLKRVKGLDEICVATTHRAEDDIIVDLAKGHGAAFFRGPVEDVLTRIAGAAEQSGAEFIVHASSDNPLISPEVIGEMISKSIGGKYDFVFASELAIGLFADVYTKDSLRRLDRLAGTPAYREHINAYIFDHSEQFNVFKYVPLRIYRKPHLRLTVDTEKDMELIRKLYMRFYRDGSIVDLHDVMKLSEEDPELFLVNADVKQYYVSEAARKMRAL